MKQDTAGAKKPIPTGPGGLGGPNGAMAIEFVAIYISQMKPEFSKPVRAGIFVASPATNGPSSVSNKAGWVAPSPRGLARRG